MCSVVICIDKLNNIIMRKLLFVIVISLLALSAHADVLGEYSFEGKIGDNIPFKVKFCVNGDEIAVGEIYYPKAKHPAPILLVGSMVEDHYISESSRVTVLLPAY